MKTADCIRQERGSVGNGNLRAFPASLLQMAAKHPRCLLVYVGSFSDIRHKSSGVFGDLVIEPYKIEMDDNVETTIRYSTQIRKNKR